MDFITQCYRGIREQPRRKAETVAIARARQGRPSRNSMTKQLHNTRHPTFLKNKTHEAHGFLLHSATEGNFHQLKENDVSHSFSYFSKAFTFSSLMTLIRIGVPRVTSCSWSAPVAAGV